VEDRDFALRAGLWGEGRVKRWVGKARSSRMRARRSFSMRRPAARTRCQMDVHTCDSGWCLKAVGQAGEGEAELG
jgi:hypothetical protein